MAKFVINGGNELYGKVKIQGAKNSVLPLLAGAILTEEEVVINNVPNLKDVNNMVRILEALGASVKQNEDHLIINADKLTTCEIHSILAKELRSSIFLLGSILARQGCAKVAYPGGCDIGMRPIDIHIKGLRELNVEIIEDSGSIFCDAKNMTSGEVCLDYPSVGATENLMLVATRPKGITIIRNAACEPEIVDLQNFINKMGGKVRGAGTSIIMIEGGRRLKGTAFSAMSDRIVTGTLAIAAVITGGELWLEGAGVDHNNSLFSKMRKTSCFITQKNDIIHIKAKPTIFAIENIKTQPYPGFPTDLQSPIMALQTVSKGICILTENVFENRFRHVAELKKMGADITITERTAVIKGVERLNGAEVYAQDLRGGASLVLAGLNAKGTTVINDIYHIDRGYEQLEEVLRKLGADIKRL
ncbi:MAG: UDP-N-acetylglucosamine 1-carboxyvinyltransferase [Clostridia bacterium]